MPDFKELQADLDLIRELSVEAGKIAMRYFGDDPKVWMKEGDSPVSEADYAVDQFLQTKLLEARPDYGWLSEETEDTKIRLGKRRTFVVDPIDGTRGFINGMRRWCVSVAVVEDNRPIVGVLECPVMEQTIVASFGQGALVNGNSLSTAPSSGNEPMRVTGPRSLETALFDTAERAVERTKFVPSLAYRIAMVAMGEVDLAVARGSAKDWDLAAADLIAQEAGARLTGTDGKTLLYNCSDPRHGALVASHAHVHNEMLDLTLRAMNKQK